MKSRNALKAVGVAAVSAVGALMSSAANAAIDISASTTAATTDVETAGGLIVGVIVAVAAIAWVRRVIH